MKTKLRNGAVALLIVLTGCLTTEKTETKTGASVDGVMLGADDDGSSVLDPDVETVRRLAELMEDCTVGDLACLARRQQVATSQLVVFDDRDCSPEATPFGGGEGTMTRPYLVCSPVHLYNTRLAPNQNFLQTRDLDLYGFMTMAAGSNFDPIPEFSGVYDGNSHYIHNLTLRHVPSVASPAGPARLEGQGLFASISFAGVVRNLKLRRASVSTDILRPLGVIAGINRGTIIDSAVLDSSINIFVNSAGQNGSRAGVIAGLNTGLLQRVTSSNFAGYMITSGVTAAMYAAGARFEQVGGIAGYNEGLIIQAQSAGTFTMRGQERNFGGITGINAGEVRESVSNVRLAHASDTLFGGIAAVNSGTISRSRSLGAISGRELLGGIAAENSGTIYDCDSASGISITGSLAGGIAAVNTGTIELSRSTGRTGASYANGATLGGIAGRNEGQIRRSSSTGLVHGLRDLGGAVAHNANRGVIENVYARGNVQGRCDDRGYLQGGLVGLNEGAIRNSFATGVVVSNASSPSCVRGGLTAVDASGSAVSGSYWDRTRNPTLTVGGGAPRTTAELRLQATYDGWDFLTVWMPQVSNPPALRP